MENFSYMMSKKVTIGLMLLFVGTQISINQQIATAQTSATPTTTSSSICPAQLGASINNVINRPLFARTRWGILVQNLSSGQTLYRRESQKYFIPASNNKLLTSAAALQQLGPDFRIRTSVYQDRDGVLRVVGRGDPSLKDAQLTILAKQLSQKGIRQVEQLIADDSYFQGEVVDSTWEWEDVQADYGAPVSSLILNENATVLTSSPQTVGQSLEIKWMEPQEGLGWKLENNSLTVEKDAPGSVSVIRDLKGQVLKITGQLAVNSQPDITGLAVFDPVQHFVSHFRQSLSTEGITVKQIARATSNQNQQELASVESPTLSQLLVYMNINSNNLYAESLLRALGSKQTLEKNQTTVEAGLKVLKTTLTQLGVEPTSYFIVDGSGLSRRNLLSPQALVQVLQAMSKSEVFRASLPVAGVSGTLKNRFVNTPAMGIVQAKTGTMTGVVSLSGYVNVPNSEPLVFSIMVNQSGQPTSVVRKAMDEIVVSLTQLRRC